MQFEILTDTAANLTRGMMEAYQISVVPLEYSVDGVSHACISVEDIDAHALYSTLRDKAVQTTQTNPQRFIDALEPVLAAGRDALIITISSGVSGTCGSAGIAAQHLQEEFPERTVRVVDSLGASLGEGMLALRAAELRGQGKTLEETFAAVEALKERVCQVFTVDDLHYLRKGGRIHGATALVGTLLNVKPILKGNEHGKIVMADKVRGRKRAIAAMAEKYDACAVEPEQQRVYIAHADCAEDAAALEALLKKNRPPREILTVCYEPVTGVHVGPGALALFFEAEAGVRLT